MNDHTTPSLNLSIILITLNEERHLADCLASLPAGAELIVVDSDSRDRTRDIATQFGARTEIRPFRNYGDQKNAALELATREWVFSIDADEVVDSTLRARLADVVRQSPEDLAFRVRRQLMFLGRPLRFGRTEDYPLRLFRRRTGRFVGELHERLVLSRGKARRLRAGRLFHHSYDDLHDYFTRFNLYTTRYAEGRWDAFRAAPVDQISGALSAAVGVFRWICRLLFCTLQQFVYVHKICQAEGTDSALPIRAHPLISTQRRICGAIRGIHPPREFPRPA